MSRLSENSTFSAAEMAELLGLTPRHIARLAADGLIPKTGRGRYPASAVAAYCDHLRGDARRGPADFAAERARLTRAKADLAEIELQRQRGEVVERADAEAGIVFAFSRVRARFLALPAKLAPQMAAARDPRAAEAMSRRAINDVLDELSETTPEQLHREAEAMADG